ncbi:MAG: hypothetical protein R2773_03160 [Flavobacteriaceae bacterium]
MKKTLITFLFLINSATLLCQDLEDRFTNALCECYTKIELTTYNNKLIEDLEACFSSSLGDIDNELAALFYKTYPDTNTEDLNEDEAFELGYKFGYEWAQQAMINHLDTLINDCKGLYEALSISRSYSFVPDTLKIVSRNEIPILDVQIKKDSTNTSLLLQRGYHQMVLGAFEKGRKDLHKVLLEYPEEQLSLSLLALSYEYEENYSMAFKTFKKVDSLYADLQSKIAIAFLKRKLSTK